MGDQQEVGPYTDDEPMTKGLFEHMQQEQAESVVRAGRKALSPHAGSIVPPPGAGTRTEPTTRLKSEHRDGGMLGGALVAIHLRSERGKTVHRCRVLDFVSVPAPHLVVELEQEAHRRIFFCSAIDWIDPIE